MQEDQKQPELHSIARSPETPETIGLVVSLVAGSICAVKALASTFFWLKDGDPCANWMDMLLYGFPAMVLSLSLIPKLRAKKSWWCFGRRARSQGFDQMDEHLPNDDDDSTAIEMTETDERKRPNSNSNANRSRPSTLSNNSQDEESLDVFGGDDDDDLLRDHDLGESAQDLQLGSTDIHEQEEQNVVEQQRIQTADTANTVFLAVASMIMLALSFLFVKEPNLFMSLLILFFGLVLWFVIYGWFVDVFQASANGVWLAIFLMTFFFLLNLRASPTTYPPCTVDIDGKSGQRFVTPIDNLPWNCISPYFVSPSSHVHAEYRNNSGWVLSGAIPPCKVNGKIHEIDIQMVCCGHEPESMYPLYLKCEPTTAKAKDLPVVDALALRGACSEIVPSFSHFPTDDKIIMLFFVSIGVVALVLVLRQALAWFRQRGMCMFTWLAWGRRGYAGILASQPDSMAV